jgi:pimeloyl-ACP methyl ester carboxylesterase
MLGPSSLTEEYTMRSLSFAPLVFVLLAGCGDKPTPAFVSVPGNSSGPAAGTTAGNPASLVEARRGFNTKIVRPRGAVEPVDEPPAAIFSKVKYESPAGKLSAYLTPDPKDGKKHPAIIWITGGDCNSIGEVWKPAPAKNDQTAAAYRKAGIVMMFPSLRGGNDNPGTKEGFLGEVDDVLAAADFLAKQDYVDAQRIYLGGHSTGGTLVLLVAECSDRFRAVFSFGPADNVSGYGPEYLPFDTRNPREIELRSPGRWLAGIKSPTFVFEGAVQGNVDSLDKMKRNNPTTFAHFYPVRGGGHFDILAPTNRLIAQRIIGDVGPTCQIEFTEDELSKNLTAGAKR